MKKWKRTNHLKNGFQLNQNDVFNHFMKMAKEDNEKLWDQKYDKYIKKGLSKENARIQSEKKKILKI